MTKRYGARLNLLSDPGDKTRVVYVAQTIKSGTARNAPYRIEHREDGTPREVFVPYEDDAALLKAVRDALDGSL